ncbi:hypothetical protein [Caulobacter sp. 1776]|uniref:hypothetical protein n=1 Tax=Caulobacter sp. 1776 TaxID=3156420 RepID=UPI003394B9CC
MTAIVGTAGSDHIDVPGSGDFEVSGGAGNDTIAVRKQSYQPGMVTVDGGDGDDTLILQVYGTQSVTVHGGAGNDTFSLVSGGLVYGDAGADLFQIHELAGGGRPFTIGDFSSADRLDMTPFLKLGTGWVQGTNPFSTGFARLAQLGADTVLQIKWADNWTSFGVFKNTSATALTSAQLGFDPKIETISFLTLSSASAVMEGGKLTIDLALSTPQAQAVSATLLITGSAPGSSSSASVTVVFAAGQTKAQAILNVFENGAVGDGVFDITQLRNVAFSADPRVGDKFSIVVTDNDAQGFGVALADKTATYKALTLLDAVKAGDQANIPSLWPALTASTRDAVRALEPFAISTTAVALTAYQFFTGKSPGKAGLSYLVNSPDNASDLNDAGGIYAAMSTENRYINFSANLGLVGEGKAAFADAYKGLTFRQAVEKAYDTVIGKDLAAAGGIDVTAAINGVVASQGYFDAVATERMGGFDHDLAVKAGMIGYLIAEGQKAHVGIYARAVENFYLDLTDGSAQHNVDLVAVYGPGTFLDAM